MLDVRKGRGWPPTEHSLEISLAIALLPARTLFIPEIVFKIVTEVITMEEAYVSRSRGISRESLEYADIKETFEGDERKSDCYTQCVNDAWDLRDESLCSSACGF